MTQSLDQAQFTDLPILPRELAISTDLYELTMAAAYFDSGLSQQRATFELFVRRLPARRSFLLFAGLEQVLEYLSTIRFTPAQIDYLRKHQSFHNVSSGFFDYMAEFKFTGDVWSLEEGVPAFAMEPLIRVTAPIIEAQIVETFLLSTVNFQTMIASKAARIVRAAAGRSVIEFGTRRAHGSEAGLLAARAAYIGGCHGTSNVEAGYQFGIPTFGTLAHSFVMSFDREDDAFEKFLAVFPDTATVLVDTYDTIEAVKRLTQQTKKVPAVRLDSGDLSELSKQVRAILDAAGMTATRIFVSSDLNEYRIRDLLESGACIDSFGVGTELATSYDAPALPGVYKLVAIQHGNQTRGRIKLSQDKASYPGAKQVWRISDKNGRFLRDVVALDFEDAPTLESQQEASATPLLTQVMRGGVEIAAADEAPSADARAKRVARLERARTRAAQRVNQLPAELRELDFDATFQVSFSAELRSERRDLELELRNRNHGPG